MKKVLFFSPHSHIWLHAYPEALLAEALVSQGMDVHYVTCGRALKSWCLSMESIGANESISLEEKARICNRCEHNATQLLKHFQFTHSALNTYLDVVQRTTIDAILASIQPRTVFDFELDGIPVGRASLYNFTLNRKKYFEREFSSAEWDDFLKHFESSLISFYAGKNLLAQHRPDRIIFYSSSYSVNLVVHLQAKKLGIPCFSIGAGSNWFNRLQRMYVFTTDNFDGHRHRLKLWHARYKALPATIVGLGSALRQNKTLLAGNHDMVYGGGNNQMRPQDIRERWGIPAASKLLFIATSSYDELAAAQTIGALPQNPRMAFQTQIEWIEKVIEYVAKRKDLSLVIRVHPRELPNQREDIGSEHSLKLKVALRDLPKNVRVNWPDDGMSLYDWLEVIDVGLTSWSSAGKEFALWGIPNLSYTGELAFYPKEDLGYVGETFDEFFQQLECALHDGWSWERVLLAYRWQAHELESAVFDLSDAIPEQLITPRSFMGRVLNKLTFSKLEHWRWFRFHSRPLAQALLIARRILDDDASDDVLEETRNRLSPHQEKEYIKSVVEEIVVIRFGHDWRKECTRSPLLTNLNRMLLEKDKEINHAT
jgi:hypothetical protein